LSLRGFEGPRVSGFDDSVPVASTAPIQAKRLRLGYRVEYAVFRAAFALFSTLPRTLALRLGAWLGEIFYLVDAPDRRVPAAGTSVGSAPNSATYHTSTRSGWPRSSASRTGNAGSTPSTAPRRMGR
jgi:hypothetical protein